MKIFQARGHAVFQVNSIATKNGWVLDLSSLQVLCYLVNSNNM